MLQLCYNGFAWPKDHVMITVNAKVFEHHQKEDGTWNVKICVYHQGVRRYVETTHFVSKKQLDAKFKIKDKFLLKLFERTLDEYREAISQLGSKVNFFTCDDLVNYLKEKIRRSTLSNFAASTLTG